MEEAAEGFARNGRAALDRAAVSVFRGVGYERSMDRDEAAEDKAEREAEEVEEAKEEMKALEEGDPPEKLEDWPGGKAKYQTYGGPDSGEGGYEDGATAKLGPSNLRHHEDGSISIDGEEVDDPDEYKGEPIPGGPTDPHAPPDPAMIGQEDEEKEDAD
jgi:hypothetical protein